MAYPGPGAQLVQAAQADPLATALRVRHIETRDCGPVTQAALTQLFLHPRPPLIMRYTVPPEFRLDLHRRQCEGIVEDAQWLSGNETMNPYEWFLHWLEHFWPNGGLAPEDQPTGRRLLHAPNFLAFLANPALRETLRPALPPYLAGVYRSTLTEDERIELMGRVVPGFSFQGAPAYAPRYGPPYAFIYSGGGLQGPAEDAAALMAAALLHERLVLTAASVGTYPDVAIVPELQRSKSFAYDFALDVPVLLIDGTRFRGCLMTVAQDLGRVEVQPQAPVIYRLERALPPMDLCDGEPAVRRFADWIFAAHYRGQMDHRERMLRDARACVAHLPQNAEGQLQRPAELEFAYDRHDGQRWHLRVRRRQDWGMTMPQ